MRAAGFRYLVALAMIAVAAAACGTGTISDAPRAPAPLPPGVLTHVEIPTVTGKTVAIDILLIDQDAHLLYVADRTDSGIDVLDVSTPKARYLRSLDVGGSTPNGIILAKDQNKIISGNSDSSVSIIDLKTGKLLANLPTGGKKRTDEIDYDPKTHKAYAANSDDGFVTVIDVVTNRILKKIDKVSAGGLEQPRYNPIDGMMYLTLSDANQIVQFDTTRDELTKRFDIGVACNPQGFAINPKTGQALLGCGNKKSPSTVLWDMKTAKVISTFDQAGAGDMTLYSEKVDRFFFAASNYTKGDAATPELAIFSGSPPVQFQIAIPTAPGSHSVAFDETNKVIYVQDQKDFDGGLFAFPLPK